jgi:hypothetical protein
MFPLTPEFPHEVLMKYSWRLFHVRSRLGRFQWWNPRLPLPFPCQW